MKKRAFKRVQAVKTAFAARFYYILALLLVGLSNILYSQGSKESSEFFFRREPAKGTHR